jgi:tetratricopeptide (TPR) repeat protein
MEVAVQPVSDLFAENLPSIDRIKAISSYIHSSEANIIAFVQKLEQNLSQTGPKANLANGIGLVIVGRYREAIEKLEKGKDSLEKFLYLAESLRRMRQFDKAIEALNKCPDFQADPLSVSLQKIAVYRCSSNLQAAANELKKNANYENVSADYHYQITRPQLSFRPTIKRQSFTWHTAATLWAMKKQPSIITNILPLRALFLSAPF